MNERCKNCGHSPASHDNWGGGPCAARSCDCQAYVEEDLYAPVQTLYTFCGLPLRDGMAENWPPDIPIRDERDGSYVVRERTAEYVGVPRKPKRATA